MTLDFTPNFTRRYNKAPANIQKTFDKQSAFLLQNLHHPSLRAKKYDETKDIWQARVTKNWRFFFKIVGDTYIMENISAHPK